MCGVYCRSRRDSTFLRTGRCANVLVADAHLYRICGRKVTAVPLVLVYGELYGRKQLPYIISSFPGELSEGSVMW